VLKDKNWLLVPVPGPWVQQEKYSWPKEKRKLGNPDLKIDRERNAVNLVI
jgi:hypothetical protein